MNRYCSMLFAVLAVGAGASFVHAETSYTIGDGKLTIAVPAGESNEISAAKFQEALAAEVTDIEMNGPGRLIVNQDTTAYTGTIHILGGTWRVVDSRGLGAVGTAPSGDNKYVASIAGAGNVYVAGGTLEAVSDTVNGIQYWGKVVYFEGTGQDGAGALVAKLSWARHILRFASLART